MHTKTEQYKGHTIEIVSYDGLGTVSFRFFVKADGFKTEGYATLNNAKGAITKHINAPAPAQAAKIANADHASVSVEESMPAGYTHPAPHWPYAGTGSEWTGERNPQGHKIASDPAHAKLYAEMDYYGMGKARDSRSRNKREGHFAGQEDGRLRRGEKTGNSVFSCTTGYYAPTRKHRKAAHMEVLNSTRQGAFGGVIKDFQF